MNSKPDARTLSFDAIEEKRRTAQQLRKLGMTRVEISEIVGAHPDTVGKWLKIPPNKLKINKRGPKKGEGTLLSQEQSDRIKKLIIAMAPDQLRLDCSLWTRQSVRQLILQEYGLELAVRTVGDYLKRWGVTPQKPQKRAHEQRAPEVAKWLKKEYPDIKVRAKSENAEIYWGAQTGLRNHCQHRRGCAPKGEASVIKLNVNSESINMISAVTNQGKVLFQFFEGTLSGDVLIEFMIRLVTSAGRKVILIQDDLQVHHCNSVKQWLEDHRGLIEVFYLPVYSP